MTFIESVKTCLTTKYATFNGRASRSEYWWFWLLSFLVGFIIGAGDLPSWLSTLVSIALLIPQLAAGVRRIHDSNHNGWWIICPVVNLVMLLLPGTDGENDYGSEPYD